MLTRVKGLGTKVTPPWYKISVFPFCDWLTQLVWLMTHYLLLRLWCVVCKMLLCIGSVLTDCICTASQTDTIAGLLKSDFLRNASGNWFKMLVVWAIFVVARGLRAVHLSEPGFTLFYVILGAGCMVIVYIYVFVCKLNILLCMLS